MQQQTVGEWLDELASAAPTPGGGAAAALSVALGASLVSMVCNLTIGKPRYADHEATMRAALTRAQEARAQALRLADEDATAFGGVMAAYRLPKATEAEVAERSEAIQTALHAAADVPLRTGRLALDVLTLAEDILDGANVNVLSDVAVAAATIRAALDSAVINVLVNLASITADERRARLDSAVEEISAAVDRADAVVTSVRSRLRR
jgi:formiminotetrahydrofolate cyclodeaminase